MRLPAPYFSRQPTSRVFRNGPTSIKRASLTTNTQRFGRTMYGVLRALLLKIFTRVLVLGRCLPCRDRYASAEAKRCCDNSTGCVNDHDPSSKGAPCFLMSYVLMSVKVDSPRSQKTHFVPELRISSWLWSIADLPAPMLLRKQPSHRHTPPPLYVLQERYLI